MRTKEQQKEWYLTNRERILSLRKRYYQKHREEVLDRVGRYRRVNKQKIAEGNKRYRIFNIVKIKEAKKRYSILHKEQLRTYRHEFQLTHPRKNPWAGAKKHSQEYYQRRKAWFSEKSRRYYQEHEKEIRGRVKEYRQKHPEIGAVDRHNRRARIKAAGGKISLTEVQQIYENNIKQFGTLTCYLCGLPIVFGGDTLDHKTPLIRGGINKRDNLVVAHRHCNSRKNRKTEDEYREYLKCLI